MALSFKAAKALIEQGQDISLSQLGFDINYIDEDSEYGEPHESSTYENEYETITRQTLVHVAIISSNVAALRSLLSAGANTDIPREIITIRTQRNNAQKALVDPITGWTPWEEISRDTHIETSEELARRFNNPGVMQLLNLSTAPRLR